MPIRLVVSIHGADLFPKGQPRESYPLPLRWLLDASDAIVAPSHAFRDDLLRVFPKHSWKAMTIHNGLPVDHLRGETSSFEIPLRGRFALCIAQHNEKKALHVLIEAFAGIAAEVPDVFLVIAGDGPRFEANRRLVETLRMAERIRLLGDVPRDAIRALCRGCELGVLPSISEPFGIALLEIMACGKAVVASRTGGIPEIVRDGEEGLLVPPGDVAELADALRTLLANPAKAARLGGRGRERVEMQFLASHNAERYGALFASLLGGVGERAGASSTSADTSRSPGR